MAEEAKQKNIEVEATKGRTDELEEGRVGRKGEALKARKNLERNC